MSASAPTPDVALPQSAAGRAVPFPPEQSNFLRSLFHYRGDPIKRFTEMRRDYPPLAGFRLVGKPIVVAHDPDVIEEVLVKQHSAFVKDGFTAGLSAVLGQGLLTSEGEDHKRQRKLVAPSLGATEVTRYLPAMFQAAAAFADSLQDGARVDAGRAMMRLTLDILTQTLFGQAFTEYELVEGELDATMAAFRPYPELLRMVTPQWVPLPSRRRLRLARERIHALVDRLLAEKRQNPEQGDLLSRLIAARDGGNALSDAELRDQVITLFLAGHETTALSLGYALRLLSENPQCRARVEAEVDALSSGAPPSAEDLRALQYTHAVFQETLRLFPPAWVIGREATRDCVLAGWQIEKGTQIMLPIYTVHRDPRWFEEPDAFRPERFLPGGAVKEGRLPRFAYVPFGAGPRVCVGNHFAMLEALAILTGVLSRVRLENVAGAPFDLAPSVTLRPRYPLPMRVERR